MAWLQFLVETEHGGILADDMGLGKTAQTLAHVLMEKQAGYLTDKPVLIVAPPSLMHKCQKEAEKFTPYLWVLLLHGASRQEKFEQNNTLFLHIINSYLVRYFSRHISILFLT